MNSPVLKLASEPITGERIRRAKAAYTTRRVDLTQASRLRTEGVKPRSGDLVLARVEQIGQHPRIELRDGRRARLHPGDEVVLCFGSRYAPDQFEAYVPENLSACHMVAAGGIAGVSVNKHERMKAATRLRPLGVLARDDGEVINLADFALPETRVPANRPPVYAVVGASMNAGKTTCVGSIIAGFRKQGRTVGAAKITGTGAGGDRWVAVDAGADMFLDFTDAGAASTFGLEVADLVRIFETLIGSLARQGAEVIVLEIADGIVQTETAALIRSPAFARHCDGVVFAATDALGASGAVARLRDLNLDVRAVSGLLTASPLATREAQQLVDAPIVCTKNLSDLAWLATEGAADRAPATDNRADSVTAGDWLAVIGIKTDSGGRGYPAAASAD